MTASVERRRAEIAAEIAAIEAAGRLRRRSVIDGPDGRTVVRRGEGGRRRLLNWAGNDYLGGIGEVVVRNGAARQLRRQGSGAGAARLLAGGLSCHRELEQAVAAFLGREDALLTPSGYQANVGALPVLASQREDVLLLDRLCHASLYDGARLAAGRLLRFAHNDVTELESRLTSTAGARRRIVVVESVYSMDGDEAPLVAIAVACARHDAWLVVDEAHALGVLGPGGRGLCAELGVRPDLLVATCSKSLSAQGGLLIGDAPLMELLVNQARSQIFSTALAPAAAGAALAALRRLKEDPQLSVRLLARAAGVRAALRAQGWAVPEGRSPIIPLIAGDEAAALGLAAALDERGHYAPAIRPPTVPPGSCRLRLSVTLAHRDADIRRLLAALADLRSPSPVPSA